MEEMETKQEVTKKFILGIVIIVISLVLGLSKFLVVFPGNSWRKAMVIVYVASWIILIPGIILAGMEGYRLVTHRYKEYHRRTIHKVKEKSKSAAIRTVNALKKPRGKKRKPHL